MVLRLDHLPVGDGPATGRLGPTPHQTAIEVERLLCARVSQNRQGERVSQDLQPLPSALERAIGPNVILVGMGVDDTSQGNIRQRLQQLRRAVGAAGIYQQAVLFQQIGAGPVSPPPQDGAGQVEADHVAVGSDFEHRGAV